MKVQLFGLAALATLAISPAAFAGTVSNGSGSVILQGQHNTAINAANITQGGAQTAVSTTTQTGTATGGSVASVSNGALTAIGQGQTNTAICVKNGVQGGAQSAVSTTTQTGKAQGPYNAKVSVSNTAATVLGQDQENMALYTYGVGQGGPQTATNTTTQTGHAINDPAPAPVKKHHSYVPHNYFHTPCKTGYCK